MATIKRNDRKASAEPAFKWTPLLNLAVRILRGCGLQVMAILILFFCLVPVDALRQHNHAIAACLQLLLGVVNDRASQWMVYVSFCLYFALFVYLRSRFNSTDPLASGARLCLVALTVISALEYCFGPSTSSSALLFIGGPMLGNCIALGFEASQSGNARWMGVLSVLCVFTVAAMSTAQDADIVSYYEYGGRVRWSGPWGNPNIGGLLMGVDAVIGFGCLMLLPPNQKCFGSRQDSKNNAVKTIGRFGIPFLLIFNTALAARWLFLSYSRGAWLGAICGGILLFWLSAAAFQRIDVAHGAHFRRFQLRPGVLRRLRKNAFPFIVIIASVIAICFWRFQDSAWHPVRRAFSSVNSQDFSWRNRVEAWRGALQIMGEHPWLGVGWDRPELLYEHYYMPPKLSEGEAVVLNDYLTVGTSLGIPAMALFVAYLWLSCARKASRVFESPNCLPLATVGLGACCVLLIGFWLDGGLFKLPTAVAFWFLLEFGNADNRGNECGILEESPPTNCADT